MKTDGLYVKGNIIHLAMAIPFIAGFATNTWAVYDYPDTIGVQFGLWNVCTRKETNSTPPQVEHCKAHSMHELSASFHLTRTAFCLTLLCYFLCALFKWSIQCKADDDKIIRQNLYSQAAVFLFSATGAILFPFAKEDYDKKNEVNSHFAASVIVIWVVCGIEIIAAVLTSLPLLEQFHKKLKKKCRSCCCKGTRNSTTEISTFTDTAQETAAAASNRQSSSTAATTTVTVTSRTVMRTVATSTSCTDLSMVEIPRPPPYSERDSNYNAWFELFATRSRNVDTSTNPGPNSQTDRRDSNVSSQDSGSRPSSRGIFTVLVNPAPPPPASEMTENGNLQTPSQSEPSVPPPRYEDITADSGLQPNEFLGPPTAPPPPYESVTSSDGATSGPLQLDDRLVIVSRVCTPLPPSQSDV